MKSINNFLYLCLSVNTSLWVLPPNLDFLKMWNLDDMDNKHVLVSSHEAILFKRRGHYITDLKERYYSEFFRETEPIG